jgi:hypothetical protein
MIPSLLQIPSAVSDSKLHSVLPNNGKGDFQFDRSTGATRINRDGLIEEVGYFSSELVQNGNFSELGSELIVNGDFATDSDWNNNIGNDWQIVNGKLILTTTSSNNINQGGLGLVQNKFYKIVFTITNTTLGGVRIRLGTGSFSSTYTDGTHTLYLQQTTTNDAFRFYSDSSGVFNGEIDNVSVKQVDPNDIWTLGTGWSFGDGVASCDGTGNNALYQLISLPTGRLKIKFDITARTQGSLALWINKPAFSQLISADAVGSYEVEVVTTSGANNLYFYAASNFIGSIDNISLVEVQGDRPRLSYDITNGVVEDKPHLLLEPSSTNLVTFSEDFSQWEKNSGGTGVNPIVTVNDTTAPDGTQTADKIVFNKGTGTTSSDLSILKVSFSSGSNTASVYVKADSSQRILIRNSGTWIGYDIGTEWVRIEKTDSGSTFQIGLRDGVGVSNVPNTSTVFLWGAQVETTAYATSYIPTAGTIISRGSETCNNSKPSVNSTEGVLYAEIQALAADSTNKYIALSDGSLSNRVNIFFDASNVLRGFVTGISSMPTSATITDFNKIALKYKSGDISLFLNGSEVATKTDSISLSGLNTVAFDNGGGSIFYGKVKGLAVYNEALSESQLMQLTGVTATSIYDNFVTRTASFTVEALNEVKKVIDNL